MTKMLTVPAADASLSERWDFELSTTNTALGEVKLPEIGPERPAKVRAALESLEATLRRVDSDPKLSEHGKEAARKEAVAAALAVIDSFERDAVTDFDKRIVFTEQNEIRPPERLDATEQLLRQVRLGEIRQRLGVDDQVMAEAVFFDEAATEEIREALLTAPPSLVKLDSGELRLVPLVSEETRAKYMLGEAERRNPEAYKRLVGLRRLREVHVNFAHTLRAMIAKKTGVDPQADPVAEMARGGGTA